MTARTRKHARVKPVPKADDAAPPRRSTNAPPVQAIQIVGNMDLVDPDGVVEGWCWSPNEPNTRRVVALLVDGIEAARAICDEMRPDLASAGVGDGAHAFLIVLQPSQRRPGQASVVLLRDVATGQIVGGAATVTWRSDSEGLGQSAPEPVPVMQGHLDGVTKDGRISGWCWYPDDALAHVRLQILVDDEVVGVTTANGFRPDLQQAGIGDGTHGFSFALPWSVLQTKGTLQIVVRDEATLATLGAPILLRLGRLAESEDRVAELERQIRLMRAQIDELTRELDMQADDRPLADMFATFAALFGALAQAPSSADAPRMLAGWRSAGETPLAIDPAALLRQAVDELRKRLAPFDLAIPDRPVATIAIPARADAATLHRCLRALRDAGVDRLADIVLVEDASHRLSQGLAHEAALMPSVVRNVHLLRAQDGGGIASCLMELARTARGTLLGYVDPELVVSAGWLDEIADTFARDSAAGLVGGLVVGADGLIRHAGLVIGDHGLPEPAGLHDDATLPEFGFLRAVDGLGALAFAIQRSVLLDVCRAGGEASARLQEPASMMLELCLRVRLAGRNVLLQPRARATCDDAADFSDRIADLCRPGEERLRLRQTWFETAQPPLAPVRFVGHALVIDNDIPRTDRDAGSIATLEQMNLLRRLGYHVTFAAIAGTAAQDPAADQLQGLGIELVRAPHYASISDYLERHGSTLEIVQVYRHMNAAMFLDRVRALAPQAKLIFSPADLHHLREMRHATVSGLSRGEAGARETRDQELHCVRYADATILNSDFELGLLKREVEPGKLRLLRWITRPAPSPRSFAERSGLCFVGNYRHGPNVDGVRWFVHAVMPVLRAQRAGLTLHIAGSEMTDEVRALAGPDVVVHGWVEDLADLFSRMRLSVAPLRFGAGFKGKVATSLAHGVPVVGTSIAMEGTGLRAGEGIAFADNETEFAAEVLRLHTDPELWNRLSASAVERCTALYSPEAALNIYRGLLHDFGLPVLAA
jgi:glycosyltransferase involved in cell wall biosynthesis/GT2 family glycosyltransferase